MKKHLLFLFTALLPLVASAEKVEIDGIWYNLIPKGKAAEVTSGGNYTGSITIPATVTYDGVAYSVTSIGNYAFAYCSSLTSITLPEGVTSIGDYVFRNCRSLTAITIPEGVTSIGEFTFYGCSRLTAINIPASVTSIGEWAFSNCSSLTAINIPEGVTSIGSSAFYGCSSLTSITLPEGVTSIGYNAFYGCSSLTAINIPEGVTSIGDGVFSGCSRLTAINIPEGVTGIGEEAFYNCSSLTAINIPEGVTSIGYNAFYGCRSLTAVYISSIEAWCKISFGSYDSNPLYYAHNLYLNGELVTELVIPEGVTSIEGYAFYKCSSLTTIVLPKSVKYIYSEAFANCPELTDVYCHAETVPSTETDAFDGSYIEYATLHVPASAINSYKGTAPWSSFGTIVSLTEEKVTSITLSHTEATLTEGQTLTLIATVEPGYATDKTITWSSSDSNVASVDDNGKVTAIAPGTATIIAKASDGSGVSASCEVTVEAMPTEVTITINQYGSGTYCSKYALDFSNVEGLKAYAAAGYNNITGVVTLLRLNTSQPGEGLFIKGEPGKYMVPVMESTGDNTLNMLVGTLAKTAVNKTSDDGLYRNFRYTTKTGVPTPMFYEIADGSTLGAGKAYLQIPTAWLPAEAKAISLRFEEGEGTTNIENTQFTIDNSQLIFDLYGRRVDNPVKGGIYIVNGKKVVM